ncbi:RICIN domain-containing protein, partial [Micromonospora sp. NPDC047753]
SAAQTWAVTPNSTIKSLGKCLDVAGAATADGTKIQLYTCNGTAAQNWVAQADGTLRSPASGKCLDVSGNNSADSTAVHLWTCVSGAANQKWILP